MPGRAWSMKGRIEEPILRPGNPILDGRAIIFRLDGQILWFWNNSMGENHGPLN